MVFPVSVSRPPTPQAHRRFRITIACFLVVILALLVLQYTPFPLVPARKTAELWGALVGMTIMTALVEYRWASARRD